MQVDERDQTGAWVLDRGPQAGSDSPAGIFDGNDILLFMADDAGANVAGERLPSHVSALQVAIVDPLSPRRGWVYVVGYERRAPRAPERYVDYNGDVDRLGGANVQMGFRDGIPMHLSIGDGDNLLDRLKVRAAASLFWGWLRFARSEADLTTEVVGWHVGPIRVIRHQRQRVRLGWGIRSPTFRTYTYYYRDFAELPVTLRLNFPPTYFFSDIVIEVVLDFRDLHDWLLYLPQSSVRLRIGDMPAAVVAALNRVDETTLALIGPRVTLVQTFGISPSLEPVSKRLVYRDSTEPQPPEDVPGERPGIGYALEDWEAVGAGEHGLTATSYALSPEIDVDEFIRSRAAPLQSIVEPLRAK
jgi:hypothetical protein